MDSFGSNYRRAWMIGVNALIDWQKLMLAQAKWLIAQNRSWTAPSEKTGGREPVARPEPVPRPAVAAAQAADEQRREPSPHGSARGGSGPARRRATRRKRS
ncbi:MAG TPA: hypothetical protein VF113_08830 [Stellaceae bacterium]